MERFSTPKIIIAGSLLLLLVIVTAILQILLHFNTYLALTIMLVGTVVAARWLSQ